MILVHVCKDRGELRQSLYAWIPGLFVYLLGKLLSLQVRMLLHPPICFDNFCWIRRRWEYLADQCVWVQRNRCHQLLQLFPRLCDSAIGGDGRASGGFGDGLVCVGRETQERQDCYEAFHDGSPFFVRYENKEREVPGSDDPTGTSRVATRHP
jgi:hypothetical protein